VAQRVLQEPQQQKARSRQSNRVRPGISRAPFGSRCQNPCVRDPHAHPYSSLKLLIGSRRVARYAGRYDAPVDTTASTNATPT